MATEAWIDSAARTPSPATGNHIDGRHLLHLPPSNPLTDALEADLARWMVRRLANRHACDGLCDTPEHTADAAAIAVVWELLGLTYPEAARG